MAVVVSKNSEISEISARTPANIAASLALLAALVPVEANRLEAKDIGIETTPVPTRVVTNQGDITHQSQLGELKLPAIQTSNDSSPGSWWSGFTTAIIGILGVGAAVRGITKGTFEGKSIYDAMVRFNTGIWRDYPQYVAHRLENGGDTFTLNSYPYGGSPLSQLINNWYALWRFTRAFNKCTPEEPFIPLHFKPGKDGKPDGVGRTGQFLADSFVRQFRDGILAASVGVPTRNVEFCLIPVCQFEQRGSGKGEARCLVIHAVPMETFRYLSDPATVKKLSASASADPKKIAIINLIHQAFGRDKDFTQRWGECELLFQRVQVLIPEWQFESKKETA